jgi:biotin carboxylase
MRETSSMRRSMRPAYEIIDGQSCRGFGSLVLVGCGVQEVEAVVTARRAGFRTVVLDRDPSAKGFDYADESVVIDGEDIESIVAYVLLNRKRLDIRGIWTSVNLTTTVSAVASACGMPGIPVSAAVGAQNKLLMKRLMVERGIPTPRFFEVSSLVEAHSALRELGGAAFVKSITGFGGQGCRAVRSEAELDEALADAQRISSYPGALLEEIVEGTFHDLNGLYYEGEFYAAGIVDSSFINEYPPGRPISPVEHYVECPSALPSACQSELFDLLEECTRSLGIHFGPVGGDAIITPRGPMLLEVAPRFHGAANSLWMVPRATGMDPVRAAQQVLAGQPLDLDLITPKLKRVALNKLLFASPGRITKIDGIEEAQALPGVFKVFLFHQEGDEVPAHVNSTGVSCSLFVSGDSREEARARLAVAESAIEIASEVPE